MSRNREFREPDTSIRVSVSNAERVKSMLHYNESMDDRIGMLINFYESKGSEIDKYIEEQVGCAIRMFKIKSGTQEILA